MFLLGIFWLLVQLKSWKTYGCESKQLDLSFLKCIRLSVLLVFARTTLLGLLLGPSGWALLEFSSFLFRSEAFLFFIDSLLIDKWRRHLSGWETKAAGGGKQQVRGYHSGRLPGHLPQPQLQGRHGIPLGGWILQSGGLRCQDWWWFVCWSVWGEHFIHIAMHWTSLFPILMKHHQRCTDFQKSTSPVANTRTTGITQQFLLIR